MMRPQTPPSVVGRSPAPGARPVPENVALIALTIVVWSSTLRGGFVFDDLLNVLGNRWVTDWRLLPQAFAHNAAGFSPEFDTSFFRPLMHVFYAATYAVAGPRPWSFHLVNVLLHLAAVLLAYALSREVLRRWSEPARHPYLPIVTGIVFAVHPAHTEAVAWIAGITDLSYTVLGLAALLLYARGLDRSRPALGAGLLLLLSLLCKETAAVFVLLMASMEIFERSRRRSWTIGVAVARLAPALVAAVVYLGMRLAALGAFAPSVAQHPHSAAELGATAATLFGLYVTQLVAPVHQHVLMAVPVQGAFSSTAAWRGILAAGALAVVFLRFRGRPLAVLALAVIVLPVLPVLWVPAIESGGSLFGERYLYLPVLGMAWCLAFAFEWARTRLLPERRAVVALGGALVIWSSATVIARTRVWHDSLSFWTAAAAESPRLAAAQEGLCFALYGANRFAEAVAACDRAIALEPARSDARVNRATALLALGRAGDAKRELDRALSIRPNAELAWINRGLACMMLGETEDALFSYRRALELAPDSAEAHNDLGVALVRLGRRSEGCPHLEQAVRLAPRNAEYRSNVSVCR
jgi:tetratricopeptide (TPR) repeat protein